VLLHFVPKLKCPVVSSYSRFRRRRFSYTLLFLQCLITLFESSCTLVSARIQTCEQFDTAHILKPHTDICMYKWQQREHTWAFVVIRAHVSTNRFSNRSTTFVRLSVPAATVSRASCNGCLRSLNPDTHQSDWDTFHLWNPVRLSVQTKQRTHTQTPWIQKEDRLPRPHVRGSSRILLTWANGSANRSH
jgi:hypothetical protein